MNFQFYLEKLLISKEFEEFKKEMPDSYFCSGFFIIEEGKGNKIHIDYFDPENKKMFSFQLESGCEKIPIEQVYEENPAKVLDNVDFNFEEIEKMIKEKMQKENIKNKIQKILLSLQNKDKKNFLIGTVFVSGLGLLKIKLDLEKNEIIEFEKKSFFDMLKIIKK
jgi:hypothetical protein